MIRIQNFAINVHDFLITVQRDLCKGCRTLLVEKLNKQCAIQNKLLIVKKKKKEEEADHAGTFN